jgi:succinyl-CoA synthetase beta subunit
MMGWQGPTATAGIALATTLLRAFLESDALLLEINPLVELDDGSLLPLDAKWTIDDDALFRHPDYEGLFDPSQLSASEVTARSHDLSYVALQGTIGCMVNGAGLAMATMDIIQHYGGSPANFLDVGGGASIEKIAAGFTLLLQDPHVEAILVNIFGGIMNCATLASGIVAATQASSLTKPIVVRMEGTNVAEGRALLAGAHLTIIVASDLADAAQKAVSAAAITR